MARSLRMRCLLAAVAACAALLACATPAHAAKLIVRNATGISLKVDSHNRALVTYRVKG